MAGSERVTEPSLEAPGFRVSIGSEQQAKLLAFNFWNIHKRKKEEEGKKTTSQAPGRRVSDCRARWTLTTSSRAPVALFRCEGKRRCKRTPVSDVSPFDEKLLNLTDLPSDRAGYLTYEHDSYKYCTC